MALSVSFIYSLPALIYLFFLRESEESSSSASFASGPPFHSPCVWLQLFFLVRLPVVLRPLVAKRSIHWTSSWGSDKARGCGPSPGRAWLVLQTSGRPQSTRGWACVSLDWGRKRGGAVSGGRGEGDPKREVD